MYRLVALCSILLFHSTCGDQQHIDPNECSPAQLNENGCIMLPYFSSYQRGICLDKNEIARRSGGKIQCTSASGYCWYNECQLALYNYGHNPDVDVTCKCEEASRDFCKNDVDHGKKRCLKLPHYESAQHVTCLSSKQVLEKSFGSGCPFPQRYCWYSCQADTYQQPSGQVSEDCRCTSSSAINVTSLTILSTFLLALVVYIFM